MSVYSQLRAVKEWRLEYGYSHELPHYRFTESISSGPRYSTERQGSRRVDVRGTCILSRDALNRLDKTAWRGLWEISISSHSDYAAKTISPDDGLLLSSEESSTQVEAQTVKPTGADWSEVSWLEIFEGGEVHLELKSALYTATRLTERNGRQLTEQLTDRLERSFFFNKREVFPVTFGPIAWEVVNTQPEQTHFGVELPQTTTTWFRLTPVVEKEEVLFRALHDATEQPLAGVELLVRMPGGEEKRFVTDSAGEVRIACQPDEVYELLGVQDVSVKSCCVEEQEAHHA